MSKSDVEQLVALFLVVLSNVDNPTVGSHCEASVPFSTLPLLYSSAEVPVISLGCFTLRLIASTVESSVFRVGTTIIGSSSTAVVVMGLKGFSLSSANMWTPIYNK